MTTGARIEREVKFELEDAGWAAFPDLACLPGATIARRVQRRYSTIFLDSPELALAARAAALGLNLNDGAETGWLGLKYALAWNGPIRIAAELVHDLDPRSASAVVAAADPPPPVRRARLLAATDDLRPVLVARQRRELVVAEGRDGETVLLTRDEISFSAPGGGEPVQARMLEVDVSGTDTRACEATLEGVCDYLVERGSRPVGSSKYAIGLELLGARVASDAACIVHA